MDISTKLSRILYYYQMNPNVGYTELTIRGLDSNEFGKIIVTKEKEKFIAPEYKNKCITFDEFLDMVGNNDNIHDPIVFDNGILFQLFLEARQKINEWEDPSIFIETWLQQTRQPLITDTTRVPQIDNMQVLEIRNILDNQKEIINAIKTIVNT